MAHGAAFLRGMQRNARQTSNQRRKVKLREQGTCTFCGTAEALAGLTTCASCHSYQRGYNAGRRAVLKSLRVCQDCGKNPIRPTESKPDHPVLCSACTKDRTHRWRRAHLL